MRLSSARCYRPPDACPPPASPPSALNGYVTFAAFNRPPKVTPATVRLWARLLDRLPTARLLVFTGLPHDRSAGALGHLFDAAGVDRRRCDFVGRRPPAAYMALFDRADVHLDTFPYNGCTTTCDALWMGVPTVSLASERHASRVGLSVLSQVGLSVPAVTSPDAYSDAAIALAADHARRATLRGELRTRMAGSSLGDSRRFSAEVEEAFRAAWVRWSAGNHG